MNKILAILAFAILTLYAYNGNYDVTESDVNIKEVPLDYKFSSFANIIPHTEDQTFVIEKEWIKKFSYSEDGYISTLSKSEEVVFNDDTIEFKFNANLDNGYGCKDTITINYTGKKLSDSSSCSYGVSYITNKDDINLTTENNITFNIKTVDSQLSISSIATSIYEPIITVYYNGEKKNMYHLYFSNYSLRRFTIFDVALKGNNLYLLVGSGATIYIMNFKLTDLDNNGIADLAQTTIINSINTSGNLVQYNTVNFSLDYELTPNESLETIFYDYTNTGNWTADNYFTFDTDGTFTINVKIETSSGISTIGSKTVDILPLAFEYMSNEQKFIKTIDPTYYDDIMAIINDEKTTSNTSGYELGQIDGKQYIQQNLSEFDLVSKPTIEVTPTTLASLDSGWTLASTPFEITDMSVFDSVNLVWIYNSDNTWSAYSSDADTMGVINSNDSINAITTIPAGSGVWVLK